MKTAMKAVGSAIDERLRLNRWFRLNAAAKNGVPWSENDEAIQVEHHVHTLPAESPAPVAVAPVVAEPIAQKTWKDALLWVVPVAALLLGGIGGWWLTQDETAPSPTPPVVVEEPKPGPSGQTSLLQDLEDRGFHLSE